MIKSELVQRLAELNPHLYQRDVENIVNTLLDEITQSLAAGRRVELRGFGAFSVKHRPARTGRNPRTGESVEVEEKWVRSNGAPGGSQVAAGTGRGAGDGGPRAVSRPRAMG